MNYIPHIKLLKTINAAYFYDVNRNEIVPVKWDSFLYLNDVLQKKINFGDHLPREVRELKEAGYLSDFHPTFIRHPYTESLPSVLKRKLRKITLQITQDCNFRCKYCIYSNTDGQKQRQHSKAKMTFETAKKAVDFLADHSIDSEQVDIGFYGGEPLLMFDLVKRVVEYAVQRFEGKTLTFSMTSNASLLTKEIVSFLAKYEIPLMISLDGPKEIQDKNRVLADGHTGTFEVVKEKLKMVQNDFPEFFSKMSVNMVIDPSNSFELVRSLENDEVFGKLRFQISMLDEEYTPGLEEDEEGKSTLHYSDAFREEYQYMDFLVQLALMGRLEESSLPKVMTSVFSSDKTIDRSLLPRKQMNETAAPSGPCIPGQKRLFIDVNGNFFPCERVSETAQVMCIGNLEDGFWLQKADDLLNIGALTANACKNCWAFSFCTLCAKSVERNGELDPAYKTLHCASVRDSAEAKLYDFLLQQEATVYYGHIV